ncbi:unnamed protein product [Rhizophagus irregularis]|nr:unnamed protein product [Rhizophagus irregularis]CAB4407178.1 unnamed protein product [Rhizophagus irregularis]
MYGNVGLSTPRGSGTNGYVVRNLSFIRPRKDIQIESLDEAKANSSALANRKPNQEILDHEKKRQVELKCISLQQKLEEAGRSEKEIEEEIDAFRQSMLKSIDIVKDNKNIQEYQTHHLSQAKLSENEKMMRALGINSKDYVEGAAFDRDLQDQKKRERIAQREKEIEQRQKKLEEREHDFREREKKWETNRNKNENQRSIHRERDRRSMEKDTDKKYHNRREKKNSSDSATDSESGNTESDSSRDNHNKRYHTSHHAKQEDSDTNENISRRKKDDYSDRDYNQKDHRMPRSPRRREGSFTRRRNRDSSIPSSRRYRDGSLSPIPRRNRDIASFRRYRNDSLSPPRRRQRSPKEISKHSERKSSLRSVSPPSYTHYKEENVRSRYRNEFETRRNISSSEKRNDAWDYSPRNNYNEDTGLSSRHHRYNEDDRSPSHDKLSHRRIEERNNSRFEADRVRKIRSSSEESDYHKNRRRRRRNDTSDSELDGDYGRKESRKNNDYVSNSNSDIEGEHHYSKD